MSIQEREQKRKGMNQTETITRGDYIRSMSNEELSGYMYRFQCKAVAEYIANGGGRVQESDHHA